jgi:SPX domain protein involved in polyphosphate accumulation
MEEKLFEFMTKMYSDLTSRLDDIDKKLDEKADKSDIVHLENKLDTNSKAMFDGYMQAYEN